MESAPQARYKISLIENVPEVLKVCVGEAYPSGQVHLDLII